MNSNDATHDLASDPNEIFLVEDGDIMNIGDADESLATAEAL